MKLYVKCPTFNKRVYITNKIIFRSELPKYFKIKCPFEDKIHAYNRNDVNAEPEKGYLAGGAILGGLIGFLGGPLGIIIGGLAGTVLGDAIERKDIVKTNHFLHGK